MRQIDPNTLAAISGKASSDAAAGFANSMASLYSVSADMSNRREQRKLNDQQMELNNLTIAEKKAKGIGSTAVGVLHMLDTTENPMNFLEKYKQFRASAPDGIREELPDAFQSPEQARTWASTTAARADKLIPYLQAAKKTSSMKQWQYTAQLLTIPPEQRTKAQQDFLAYYEKADQNIYVGGPSNEKTKDTIRGLQGYKMPGTDTPILDALDKKSRIAFISAVDALTQSRIDQARANKEVLDRATARDEAIQILTPMIQEKEALMQKIPWLGEYVDSDYVFNPGEKTLETIQGYKTRSQVQAEQKQKDEIIERGGYRWDMSDPNNPKNLGPVE